MNGHLRCSHVEILPIDWCRRCWQHKGGHQMSEVIEAAKQIMRTEGRLSDEDKVMWMQKTSHDPASFESFIENTLSIYRNGFDFFGPKKTGGKGTLLPRICKELEWGQDGRHRVAIAYVLGASHIPVVVHSTRRDFDDGAAALDYAAHLITKFYESSEWEDYKKTRSYMILSSDLATRKKLDLDRFSRMEDPSLEWEECLSEEEFRRKILSHPDLGDLSIKLV